MDQFKQDFIVRCWPFLLVLCCCMVTGLGAQSYMGQDALTLLLVSRGNAVADWLLRMITELGDVPFALVVAALVWWRGRGSGLGFYISAALVQLVIVQTIKHLFFAHQLRPVYYFQQLGITLYSMPSADQGLYFHFPSGHAAMACVAFLTLTVLMKQRWCQFLCALLVVLVAYSRLYLAQHFMLDVAAGALIGIFSVVVSYYAWRAGIQIRSGKTVHGNQK